MTDNLQIPLSSPAKSQGAGEGGIAGEISARQVQQQQAALPSNAQSMRYGDLIYLHVENVDGIVQTSG